MLTLDDVSAQIYFQFRDRQYKGLDKKRLGVFHVTDFVKPCNRNAYYSHLKIPRPKLGTKEMSVFWAGEAIHQMLDRYAPEGMGENPLAYNFVDDVKVDVTENHKMEDWLKILVGEADSLYKIKKADGSYEWAIVDYKTYLGGQYKKREADPQHKAQVNIYRYLFQKAMGIDVKFGAIVYLDYSTRMEKPLIFPFKTAKVEDVHADLLSRYVELDHAYRTGELPPRTLSWLCDYCPYVERCVVEDKLDSEDNTLVIVT